MLGIKTTDSIVQTVRAEHSGADAWHRLTHRAQFAGIVERGKEYILVDDHITRGGTLNELRSYIENEGGKVVDVIALTSSKGSTILTPRKETIDELKTRYPDINRLLREADIAGRVEALTNSEAEYIKTFSADTFRDRIAQAGQERSERLRGQALGEPPSDSVARTAWSETPKEREITPGSLERLKRAMPRFGKDIHSIN
ncbi:MAG: phosphoribosyltransferase [Kiritimatiellae bacterium]|nr:phosphoribosyltransferase [Kiritimatiellia bacterium]